MRKVGIVFPINERKRLAQLVKLANVRRLEFAIILGEYLL